MLAKFIIVVSILSRPKGRLQLAAGVPNSAVIPAFQSSAAAKDGCNPVETEIIRVHFCVSILSRREGRLQSAPGSRRV
ncbi:MAG: hypothetical protein U5L04_09555 [Trueperaceae bacterium]|nr:hypothetical protein [Trueperaceae bacterium]